MLKRILAVVLLLCLLCTPVYAVQEETAAQEEAATQEEAAAQEEAATQEQTASPVPITVSGNAYEKYSFLTNGNEFAYYTSKADCYLTVKAKKPFQSLYIRFNLECQPYTVTDNLTGYTMDAGQYGFLHEYVTLPQETTGVTLQFTGKVQVTEITAYTAGVRPADVQVWEPPHEGGADILLLSAHGDDEHLFFAGLLPLYAAERGLRVQVAYLTAHRDPPTVRCHEILNGLWSVGVRNYPVIGRFGDFRIDDLEESYAEYADQGTTQEELVGYAVELIRRFKPQVVVGHDFAGEYGHGMHMVYADMLAKALPITNDPTAYPELAEQYGLWDVPKAYVHLYEENPIVIDYDIPLESFDGMTAFRVSQVYGFPCHKSQTDIPLFKYWLYGFRNQITMASEIEEYNPSHFGLYRSLVGEDVLKNDFMENLISYHEQERLEAERLEQEKILEAQRLEQERLEAERLEAERQEQERLEAEKAEAQRLEQERQENLQKEQQQKKLQLVLIWSAAGAILVIGLIFILIKRKK